MRSLCLGRWKGPVACPEGMRMAFGILRGKHEGKGRIGKTQNNKLFVLCFFSFLGQKN
jgi:hypothetical protein